MDTLITRPTLMDRFRKNGESKFDLTGYQVILISCGSESSGFIHPTKSAKVVFTGRVLNCISTQRGCHLLFEDHHLIIDPGSNTVIKIFDGKLFDDELKRYDEGNMTIQFRVFSDRNNSSKKSYEPDSYVTEMVDRGDYSYRLIFDLYTNKAWEKYNDI